MATQIAALVELGLAMVTREDPDSVDSDSVGKHRRPFREALILGSKLGKILASFLGCFEKLLFS